MVSERYFVFMKGNSSTYFRIYRKNPFENEKESSLAKSFNFGSSIRFQNNLTPRQIIEEIISVYDFPKLESEFKKNYSGLILHSSSDIQAEKILKFLDKKFISEN